MGSVFVFGPLLHLLSRGPVHAHIHTNHGYVTIGGSIVLPIVGIMLVYLSLFVYRRRLLAAYTSAGASVLMFAYLCLMYPAKPMTYVIGILVTLYLILIIVGRRYFIIKNNLEDLPRHLRPIIVIACIGLLYGTLGFYTLGHPLFHTQFSLTESIDTTLDALTGFSGTINEPTHAGSLFIDSLGGIGIVIFALLLEAFFRPLRLKVVSHQEINDRRDAEAIIRAHSASSEDFFKLWPHDKQYFFSHDRRAFLAYKPSGRTIVILGDPVGDTHTFEKLITDFMAYCQSLGWLTAVVNATEDGTRLFEQYGLKSIFVGNEAVVDVAHFVDKTSHDKHFRYVRNRAERDALVVEEWRTPSDEQLAQLRVISDEWLARGGRREYTFFMGYFDQEYLRKSRVFVLLQQGEPVAYINLIPSFHKGHSSIDQFRSRDAMSPVGMHFLMMHILERLHGEHAMTLNIGLSPLSGVEASDAKAIPRATLKLIRHFGASYYSFQGLEQFKNKFKPDWQPRAILYTGSLLSVTNDAERAAAYGTNPNKQFYLSTTAGIIVLALGIYFILG